MDVINISFAGCCILVLDSCWLCCWTNTWGCSVPQEDPHLGDFHMHNPTQTNTLSWKKMPTTKQYKSSSEMQHKQANWNYCKIRDMQPLKTKNAFGPLRQQNCACIIASKCGGGKVNGRGPGEPGEEKLFSFHQHIWNHVTFIDVLRYFADCFCKAK